MTRDDDHMLRLAVAAFYVALFGWCQHAILGQSLEQPWLRIAFCLLGVAVMARAQLRSI